MIKISLSDPHVADNVAAIATLKQSGLFSEAEIQVMYDKQVEADKKALEGQK